MKFIIFTFILFLNLQGCMAKAGGAVEESPVKSESENQAKSNNVSEQLIVVFVEGTSAERIEEINNFLNVKVREESFGFIYVIEVPKGKSAEELRREYISFKEEVKAVNSNFGLRPQKKTDE